MDDHEIPLQEAKADKTIAQGQGKQNPVYRIGSAGLHLADQRLASPLVRVPERELSLVQGGRLKLEPGQYLVYPVGIVQPRILPAERQPPIEARDDQEQDRRHPESAQRDCCFRSSLVVFSHVDVLPIINQVLAK
jgi:hypothetical protein